MAHQQQGGAHHSRQLASRAAHARRARHALCLGCKGLQRLPWMRYSNDEEQGLAGPRQSPARQHASLAGSSKSQSLPSVPLRALLHGHLGSSPARAAGAPGEPRRTRLRRRRSGEDAYLDQVSL